MAQNKTEGKGATKNTDDRRKAEAAGSKNRNKRRSSASTSTRQGNYADKVKREQEALRRKHQAEKNGIRVQRPAHAEHPTTKVEHRPTQIRTIGNTIDPEKLMEVKTNEVKTLVATKLYEAVLKMIEGAKTPWTAEERTLAGELIEYLVFGKKMSGRLDTPKYREVRKRFATTCYFQRHALKGVTLPGMEAAIYKADLASAEKQFSKAKQLVTR